MPHTAPFTTDEPSISTNLLKAWTQDKNIDFLSPQLYSDGDETSPDFEETGFCVKEGCTWDLYMGMVPELVPSIVEESQF